MTVTFGEYRLKRYDARNWVLQRYREPAPDSGARMSKDKGATWRSCDCYFQSLGRGLEYVYEHRLISDDADVDLPGAIRRAEEIARGLRESVEVDR